MTSEEFELATGISYHVLDHWVSCGHLRVDVPNPGSGRKRSWPESEVEVARAMQVLVRAGLEPWAAAVAARNCGVLSDGVRVVVSRDGLTLPGVDLAGPAGKDPEG